METEKYLPHPNRPLLNHHHTNHIPHPPVTIHSSPTPRHPLTPPAQPPDPRRSLQSPLLDVLLLVPHQHRSRSTLPQRPNTPSTKPRPPSQLHQESTRLHQRIRPRRMVRTMRIHRVAPPGSARPESRCPRGLGLHVAQPTSQCHRRQAGRGLGRYQAHYGCGLHDYDAHEQRVGRW